MHFLLIACSSLSHRALAPFPTPPHTPLHRSPHSPPLLIRITQGLPTVFGIFEGKMVDSFTGMVPDERLREFFDTLLALSPEGATGAVQLLKRSTVVP